MILAAIVALSISTAVLTAICAGLVVQHDRMLRALSRPYEAVANPDTDKPKHYSMYKTKHDKGDNA